MKLNQRHQGLLLHRLGAGTIPEVLACSFDDISEQDAEDAAQRVEKMIESGSIDIAKLDRIEREVLRDCMDGATCFADYEDAIALGKTNRGNYLADHRAANELEKAFFEATGEKVVFVRS